MPDIQITGTVHHGRPVVYLDDLAEMFATLAERVAESELRGNPQSPSELIVELGGYFGQMHLLHCKHTHAAAARSGRYHGCVFDRFMPPV